jgi:hypothetical protein
MVGLTELLVPIAVSAVIVFVVSSLIHMVFKWHASDYRGLAKEEEAADAIRLSNPSPGIYNLPVCKDMKDMASPAMQEKFKRGPVATIVVRPNGAPPMGKSLGLWFVYSALVSLFAGYLAGRTLPAGTDYLAVFRVVGASAFMAYGLANIVDSIWKGFPWSVSVKHTFDGLLYALVTAGTFGWLWPR